VRRVYETGARVSINIQRCRGSGVGEALDSPVSFGHNTPGTGLACLYESAREQRVAGSGTSDCQAQGKDKGGGPFSSIALVLIRYGFSRLPALLGALLVLLGIAAMVGFVRFEARAETPLLNVRLFQSKTFAFSNLAALLNYSAVFMTAFMMSFYLQYIKRLDLQATRLILITQPIVQTIFSPLAGQLSDWINPLKLASLGMALSAVGLFSFAFLAADTPT
jgi:hypothetical protein